MWFGDTHMAPNHTPVVFRIAFYVFLGPHPPGGPGEGPDCHVPQKIDGFGPVPARIRGVLYIYIYVCYCYFGLKRSLDLKSWGSARRYEGRGLQLSWG